MAVYTVPTEYAGKSLSDIRNQTGAAFRPDTLASQLGISDRQALTAGQTFMSDWQDPGSAEYQALQKLFNPTSEADYYSKKAIEQQNKAIAPAISSLEQSVPITQQMYGQQAENLKQTSSNVEKRYQALLDSLTGKEAQDKAQVGLATSREFGKRGIPLSSGVFDQAMLEKTQPISQFYAGQIKETGVAREADMMKLAQALAMNPIELSQALNQIRQAQATIQMGGAKDAITNAFNQQKLAQDLTLGREQLANNLKIQELENKYNNIKVFDQGGTYYTYDLANGNVKPLVGA